MTQHSIASQRQSGDSSETLAPCRLCDGGEFSQTIGFDALPIAMQWLNRPDEERPVYPFRLDTCMTCGLLQNRSPLDAALLNASFDANISSWKSEPHIEAELDLIFAHMVPRRAVDVGCNDGRFLMELRRRGISSLLGIEPNPHPAEQVRAHDIAVYEGLATPETCAEIVARHGVFDLVVTRQVAEHLDDLPAFFAGLRTLCGPGGHLFIDVPDMEPALAAGDCSVLWEEHLTYFTQSTLEALLRREGFTPLAAGKYDCAGGTLGIIARSGTALTPKPWPKAEVSPQALSYGLRVLDYGKHLGRQLARARELGCDIVMYGTTRANMAVNGMGLAQYLSYAIDDQPYRQGKFFPGSGLPIVGSESIAGSDMPLICLLAVSHQNEAKVRARVRELTGREIQFVTMCAPGDVAGDLARLSRYLDAKESGTIARN